MTSRNLQYVPRTESTYPFDESCLVRLYLKDKLKGLHTFVIFFPITAWVPGATCFMDFNLKTIEGGIFKQWFLLLLAQVRRKGGLTNPIDGRYCTLAATWIDGRGWLFWYYDRAQPCKNKRQRRDGDPAAAVVAGENEIDPPPPLERDGPPPPVAAADEEAGSENNEDEGEGVDAPAPVEEDPEAKNQAYANRKLAFPQWIARFMRCEMGTLRKEIDPNMHARVFESIWKDLWRTKDRNELLRMLSFYLGSPIEPLLSSEYSEDNIAHDLNVCKVFTIENALVYIKRFKPIHTNVVIPDVTAFRFNSVVSTLYGPPAEWAANSFVLPYQLCTPQKMAEFFWPIIAPVNDFSSAVYLSFKDNFVGMDEKDVRSLFLKHGGEAILGSEYRVDLDSFKHKTRQKAHASPKDDKWKEDAFNELSNLLSPCSDNGEFLNKMVEYVMHRNRSVGNLSIPSGHSDSNLTALGGFMQSCMFTLEVAGYVSHNHLNILRLMVGGFTNAYDAPSKSLQLKMVCVGSPSSGKSYTMKTACQFFLKSSWIAMKTEKAVYDSKNNEAYIEVNEEGDPSDFGICPGKQTSNTEKFNTVYYQDAHTTSSRETTNKQADTSRELVAQISHIDQTTGKRSKVSSSCVSYGARIVGLNDELLFCKQPTLQRAWWLRFDDPSRQDRDAMNMKAAEMQYSKKNERQVRGFIQYCQNTHALMNLHDIMSSAGLVADVNTKGSSLLYNALTRRLEEHYGLNGVRATRPFEKHVMVLRSLQQIEAIKLVFGMGINGPPLDRPFQLQDIQRLQPFLVVTIPTLAFSLEFSAMLYDPVFESVAMLIYKHLLKCEPLDVPPSGDYWKVESFFPKPMNPYQKGVHLAAELKKLAGDRLLHQTLLACSWFLMTPQWRSRGRVCPAIQTGPDENQHLMVHHRFLVAFAQRDLVWNALQEVLNPDMEPIEHVVRGRCPEGRYDTFLEGTLRPKFTAEERANVLDAWLRESNVMAWQQTIERLEADIARERSAEARTIKEKELRKVRTVEKPPMPAEIDDDEQRLRPWEVRNALYNDERRHGKRSQAALSIPVNECEDDENEPEDSQSAIIQISATLDVDIISKHTTAPFALPENKSACIDAYMIFFGEIVAMKKRRTVFDEDDHEAWISALYNMWHCWAECKAISLATMSHMHVFNYIKSFGVPLYVKSDNSDVYEGWWSEEYAKAVLLFVRDGKNCSLLEDLWRRGGKPGVVPMEGVQEQPSNLNRRRAREEEQ